MLILENKLQAVIVRILELSGLAAFIAFAFLSQGDKGSLQRVLSYWALTYSIVIYLLFVLIINPAFGSNSQKHDSIEGRPPPDQDDYYLYKEPT